MLDLIQRHFANVRLRHAAIALLVAIVLAALTILRPFDAAIWSLQSKLFSRAPSGEIVLVTSRVQRLKDSRVSLNRDVVDALERLDDQGARLIVIDSPLQLSGSPQIDRELRAALVKGEERIILARPVSKDIDENALVEAGSRYFERGMRIASSDIQPDFLGLIWGIEASYSDAKATYPAVWNAIARGGRASAAIYPDYTIDTARLPRVAMAALARGEPAALAAVRGRTIVLEGLGQDRRSLKAPDEYDGDVSPALIQIIAAETALRGAGQYLGSWAMIAAFGLALLTGLCLLQTDRVRRIFYAAWLSAFAIAFGLSAAVGVRVMLADPLSIAVVYAIVRATFNYRRRHLYIDPRSRLPNFAALDRDLESSGELAGTAIVVAKIVRLDAILASLGPQEQGQYLRQVAARLSLGDAEVKVYHDGGKYFCFLLAKADHDDLQLHLEGLRAVASQAVTLGNRAIDVSMTIGVDQSQGKTPSRRISSAIAAADQSREAYRPVFIITDFEADSEAWDYSLQSRLETALSQNRIWIKLQPQIDLQSGRIIGAEALARWVDEQRGEISPARFILQCERAGRLDELTRRVLRLSLEASHALQEEGLPARVSANVSAVQFVDHRIADLIEQSLAETGADPANIIIEITESARIEDFTTAREIMDRIARTGIRFSIDDFGIASANLDALYRLPFSELKVDRMFANSVASDAAARAIVANMFNLSRDLGLMSVAEGIDNLATLQILREMGGDLGQGFCIAVPQTLSLLQETLRLQKDNEVRRCGNG